MERGYLNFERGSEEGFCQIESIPTTYADLFPHLIANQMVNPVVSEPSFKNGKILRLIVSTIEECRATQ